MGHPLFNNMRQGNWLFDYTVDRLENHGSFYKYCKELFQLVKIVPISQKPKYASKVFLHIFEVVCAALFRKITVMPSTQDTFIRSLVLGCV